MYSDATNVTLAFFASKQALQSAYAASNNTCKPGAGAVVSLANVSWTCPNFLAMEDFSSRERASINACQSPALGRDKDG